MRIEGNNLGELPPAGQPVIPDHELIRCIGAGSYGRVYLARTSFGVYRAVKVVTRGDFKNQKPFERELAGIRRFEPVSRSHEGFVDVLQVGHHPDSDFFYYVMELGDDANDPGVVTPETYVPKTLDRVVKKLDHLPVTECFQLGLSLANALGQLHKQGLVHRDIKPSNILFIGGIPKLADVGLVAQVGDHGSLVGTEGFIPPEGPGLPSADIYSLGKVLFEASTGKDSRQFPYLPTHVDEFSEVEAFGELNAIVLKACASAVGARYESADAMHADLAIAASGGSVKSLRLAEYRLARLKKVVGAASAVLAVLLIVAFEIYRTRGLAVEERQRTVGSKVAQGIAELEQGRLLNAVPPFIEALEADDSGQAAIHRLRIGTALEQVPKLVQMWIEGSTANSARFSPSGKLAVVAGSNGKARVYDVESGQAVSPYFGPSANLMWAAFDPTETYVVTAANVRSDGKAVCIWNARTGTMEVNLGQEVFADFAVFSPDGQRVLAGAADGDLRIWDWRRNQLVKKWPAHTGRIFSATWNSDGTLIVSTGIDGRARLWDALTFEPIGPPMVDTSWIYFGAFSPDSTRLITTGYDRKALIWQIDRTGRGPHRKIPRPLTHRGAVISGEFSPDGLMIVTASLDGTVGLWDANTLLPIALNPSVSQGTGVRHASFAPDSRRFITAAMDGTARIWDLAGATVTPAMRSGRINRGGTHSISVLDQSMEVRELASDRVIQRIPAETNGLTAVLNANATLLLATKAVRVGSDLSPNGLAYSLSFDLIKVGAAGEKATCISTRSSTNKAAFSDDGKLLATLAGRSVIVWEWATGSERFPALQHSNTVDRVDFSPDGWWLAVTAGKTVQVWDARTGRPAFSRLDHDLEVTVVEFSPDSSRLVTACGDQQTRPGYARIWRLPDGAPMGPPLAHGDGVTDAAFSSNGRLVATASEDRSVAVWETDSGRLVGHRLVHPDEVFGVAFSADDRLLVTECRDQASRIWDARTFEAVSPRLPHGENFLSVKFSPTGEQLICTSRRGTFEIWDLRRDDRTIAELKSLLPALGINVDSSHGTNFTWDARTRTASWQAVRGRQSQDFAASSAEVRAWHWERAKYALREELWEGAAFHLRLLLSERPDDAMFKAQLEKVLKHMGGAVER